MKLNIDYLLAKGGRSNWLKQNHYSTIEKTDHQLNKRKWKYQICYYERTEKGIKEAGPMKVPKTEIFKSPLSKGMRTIKAEQKLDLTVYKVEWLR